MLLLLLLSNQVWVGVRMEALSSGISGQRGSTKDEQRDVAVLRDDQSDRRDRGESRVRETHGVAADGEREADF